MALKPGITGGGEEGAALPFCFFVLACVAVLATGLEEKQKLTKHLSLSFLYYISSSLSFFYFYLCFFCNTYYIDLISL